MRLLLAALNAPKGEVAGNLQRHMAVLERARAEGGVDFPGLAALVSPSGEVARLPDWRPGTLAVEVPVDAGAGGRVAPRR
jgi:predicted amidohydrolase